MRSKTIHTHFSCAREQLNRQPEETGILRFLVKFRSHAHMEKAPEPELISLQESSSPSVSMSCPFGASPISIVNITILGVMVDILLLKQNL